MHMNEPTQRSDSATVSMSNFLFMAIVWRGRDNTGVQEGDAYWGLRGAMTGLGKVGSVKMYPILIRYVFVGVCRHIRGVRTNRNQSIPLGVRKKFTVPIGRVLIRPGSVANVSICGNR
jgi:hypothetical protein